MALEDIMQGKVPRTPPLTSSKRYMEENITNFVELSRITGIVNIDQSI